jgi:hypothetical protein
MLPLALFPIMDLTRRIAAFFLFIGAVLVFLFVFSIIAGHPAFAYLLTGLVSLLIGGAWWRRAPDESPHEPPARFRTVRKIIHKDRD